MDSEASIIFGHPYSQIFLVPIFQKFNIRVVEILNSTTHVALGID